ncbi:MAG: L-serine ammonia-lyase [Oleiphilaceae bacterium]|nr:L-serine ammonia-lyase [Oleiphilaceae bacterium]
MFIACSEMFKIGVGPSSSHTMGPMSAAHAFRSTVLADHKPYLQPKEVYVRCTLFGSLAFTGKGHETDQAVRLGLNGYLPHQLVDVDLRVLKCQIEASEQLSGTEIYYDPAVHLIWNTDRSDLPHPNFLSFELVVDDEVLLEQSYASIGGGFTVVEQELDQHVLSLSQVDIPFPFCNAQEMLSMSGDSALSIAEMKLKNELCFQEEATFSEHVLTTWRVMQSCVEKGLQAEGELPGVLRVQRRAATLFQKLVKSPVNIECHEWLSVYAIAVNEQNAAGELIVTAPTNGAAGVVPAVLYYMDNHYFEHGLSDAQILTFLLSAAAIGGLIKHNSSISGAEVGCQGEVGAASAMAAAGACALKGGTPEQVEHAAEIALEHHLGMTCDPIQGLVQVPCIERNAFGAVKAWLASDLARNAEGEHIMSLDRCISAMHETGLAMSDKYKETSLGGLAASWVEC